MNFAEGDAPVGYYHSVGQAIRSNLGRDKGT
jgi:hypothetical protein